MRRCVLSRTMYPNGRLEEFNGEVEHSDLHFGRAALPGGMNVECFINGRGRSKNTMNLRFYDQATQMAVGEQLLKLALKNGAYALTRAKPFHTWPQRRQPPMRVWLMKSVLAAALKVYRADPVRVS